MKTIESTTFARVISVRVDLIELKLINCRILFRHRKTISPVSIFSNGKKYFQIEDNKTHERNYDSEEEIKVLFVNL